MQVILQENVANLGKVGDEVSVKSGYARNFLLPLDKAVVATDSNRQLFEGRRSELLAASKVRIETARTRAEKMSTYTLTIACKASEEGKLYGSIGPREVAVAAQAAGYELNKSEVVLPEGPIHYLGEYTLDIRYHPEVSGQLALVVETEG